MSTQIDLLKKYGLPVRGRSGQHLLIDPNIQQKIVNVLDPQADDCILEIGPGLGALTEQILKRGAKVWAVEKDARFVEILRGELAREYRDRLKLIQQDILKLKLDQLAPQPDAAKWKVISNLPYYITAPILLHLREFRALITKAVLTMQKEVAARLLATPGTKDYGRLTLAVRYAADVRHLFDIAPTCFAPPPEVHSSVVELEFHPPSKLPRGLDESFLFYLIRLAFSQRRKTLIHLLRHDPKFRKERGEIAAIFSRLGLEEKVRGEDLLLKDFISLAEALQEGTKE